MSGSATVRPGGVPGVSVRTAGVVGASARPGGVPSGLSADALLDHEGRPLLDWLGRTLVGQPEAG